MAFVRCHRGRNDRGDSGSDDLRQAEQGAAADALQRPLRSRFQPRLMPGVRPEFHRSGKEICHGGAAVVISKIAFAFPIRDPAIIGQEEMIFAQDIVEGWEGR